MSVKNIVMSAAGATPDKTYIEDVFSTYLYTGNGLTQTINNGIDLAGKGGMVWVKNRVLADGTMNHQIVDTVRGYNKGLHSNTTGGENTSGLGAGGGFANTGFIAGSIGGTNFVNEANQAYASWTFRKAPKFFDVVTYTATGTTGTVNHNLGTTPGMIIRKKVDSTQNWFVWHRGLTSGNLVYLDLTMAQDPSPGINTVTSTSFNFSGATGQYVFYVFAHDTTTDGLIQCGSFTSSNSTVVNLGWEPQFILCKRYDSTGGWYMIDSMRGMTMGDDAYILANTSGAETSFPLLNPTATGFIETGLGSGEQYIYMAIRRGPMRTPTDGTKVFQPVARTGTGTVINQTVSFNPDTIISTDRNSTGTAEKQVWDRLRKNYTKLLTTQTDAENDLSATPYDIAISGQKNNTYLLQSNGNVNASGNSYIDWNFRRAPSFFDVVCYTGTGAARTVNHNLGVAPEMMIVKARSPADRWIVYCSTLGADKYLILNSTESADTNSGMFASTTPTSTSFTLGNSGFYYYVNNPGSTYVAYLFASCPGVSKVGSYTGNGSSQTINCGFSAGARFVLIKRTDSTGDWYVWDTARGIVAASDPHLSLNTTVAEVTTDDSIDPESSGFIVNQVSATNINVNAATYIYLAIA